MTQVIYVLLAFKFQHSTLIVTVHIASFHSVVPGRKGKKTAWEIWKLFPDLTPILVNLSLPLPVLDDD